MNVAKTDLKSLCIGAIEGRIIRCTIKETSDVYRLMEEIAGRVLPRQLKKNAKMLMSWYATTTCQV